MSNQLNHLASDFGTTRMELRQDLVCTSCDDPGDPHVVIEDPITGNYFRLGVAEFSFASRLSRNRPVTEVLQDLCERDPDFHLSEHDVAALCQWMVNQELAHTDFSRSSQRLNRTNRSAAADQLTGRINPLAIKIPLLQPDRWIERLNGRIGSLFSIYGTVACVGLILVAGVLAIGGAKEISRSSQQLFSPSTMFVLMAISVVLKVIHEFAHAIVCKRYGGNVGEMGVMLVLFTPLAYVDVSSVWRFRNRWQRVHVAIAGMLVEITIAAAAMIVWQLWPTPIVRYLCVNIMLSAGLMTIVFNANPLMKFDGYFAITDWLRSPNLYVDGQRYLGRLGRRYFFGISEPGPHWSGGYGNLVRVYAWLAMLWKWFVCLGLVLAASKLFHGLGILLAIIGVITWLVPPIRRLVDQLLSASPIQRARFAASSVALATTISALMFFTPWPGARSVAAVVEYSKLEVIHAEVEGFVDSVHVRSGQSVVAGEVLMTLGNPELQHEARHLDSRIEQSTIRQRQLTLQRQHAAAQAESAHAASLEEQRNEIQRQLDRLQIRSNVSGVVVRRRLEELVGTYVNKGDSLAVIGNEAQKELRVQVPESHFDRFRDCIGSELRVRFGGMTAQAAVLSNVNPRASTTTEYPSLFVPNGGPLPVRPTSTGDPPNAEYQLLAAHFEAVVRLDRRQSEVLRCGQLASVSILAADHSIGEHCLELMRRWIQ